MSLRNSKLRRRRYNDLRDVIEYAEFVDSLVPLCHCDPPYGCPCDGLMSGGPCDQMNKHYVLDDDEDDMTLEEQHNRCL